MYCIKAYSHTCHFPHQYADLNCLIFTESGNIEAHLKTPPQAPGVMFKALGDMENSWQAYPLGLHFAQILIINSAKCKHNISK